MSIVTLGELVGDGLLRVDLPTLVDTRALITGNSGAGKSRLLRRLAEQAFGKVQIIVLDPEGEFATLREKHDFLLAGKGGEVPAEPRAAALLARRLMELRASAILDLYDLKIHDQRSFVKLFLESLLELPRDQYRPVLLMVDEAHKFCPEKSHGEAESTEAVTALMSQGRKRGLCGILASQRLSKLAKDAAAEAANAFIGRTTLDVDQKRAADALGLTSAADKVALRDLDNGVFHAYGPALSHKGVVQFRGGPVATTHPKAGQRHKVEAPAPPEAIRKLADELKDLPAQAAEEIRTLQAAKARVRELEAELRKKPAAPAPVAPKVVERQAIKPEVARRLEAALSKLQAETMRHEQALALWWKQQRELVEDLLGGLRDVVADRAPKPAAPPSPPLRVVSAPPRATRVQAAGTGDLTGPERKVLSALAQYPQGRTVTQLAILTGYAKDGGAFRNPLSALRSKGYVVDVSKAFVRATQEGLDALGDFDPLPTGSALRELWYGRLSGPERKILQAIVARHPAAVPVAEVAAATYYAVDGGAFRNPLSRLRTLELVSGRGEVRASDDLFDA